MKRKLVISIVINICLVVFIVICLVNVYFTKQKLFSSEIQHNLVELEVVIGVQKEKNWVEPNLVTTQLGDVLNGIQVGLQTSGYISKQDKENLNDLFIILSQFPTNEVYRFSEVTEQDKENFESLQEVLRDVGFGNGIQKTPNMKTILKQVSELVDQFKSSIMQ